MIPGGTCSIKNIAEIKKTYTTSNYGDTCATIKPGTNHSYADAFVAEFPAERIASPACEKVSKPPVKVTQVTRTTIDGKDLDASTVSKTVGSSAVGAKAIELLKQKSGEKGFTVVLVSNDGIKACGQENFANATRLKEFHASAVGPAAATSLQNSVCDTEYTSITNGLKNFISHAAALEYPFSGDPGKVDRVYVTTDAGLVDRVIPPTEYEFQGGKIIFEPGAIQVGEKIQIATR